MTEKQTLGWIKTNLGAFINTAIAEGQVVNPKLLYTEDWLGAMTYRETGFLIARYVAMGLAPDKIHALMRGDYGQRPGEKEKQYHGFGYMQIDTGSYPDFIRMGSWKNPALVYKKAVSVLEEKRVWIANHILLNGYSEDDYHRMITAAYNCGAGNIAKAIKNKKDIDHYTHEGNYSREVWRLREIYKQLI